MAAPDIFPFLQTYCTHPEVIETSTISKFPHSESTQIKGDPSLHLSFVDHAAMEFFSGVIIWFDILGCVSTGLRPQYSDMCTNGVGDDSKLQLENISGCENWAMILVREIAVLSDWKRRMSEEGILNVLELAKRANFIRRPLDDRIDRLVAELGQNSDDPELSNKSSTPVYKKQKDHVIRKVTHAFAYAAKVYLCVVVSGPNPDLPEIVDSVSSTAAALRSLPDPQLIRKLAWPFCIAGSMAKGTQRQAFKDLASAAGIQENAFGSSWRAFEVMQTCWNMHDGVGNGQRNCDWLDAMKALGHHVLLV
jgi:C6 transcription factor Pro1